MVLVSDKPRNSIVLTGLIVMVMHFLQTGRKRHTLPGTEEPMITLDFITALFYEVDEQLRAIPKHPEAHLWPSEVVTLGLLHGAQRRRHPALLSVADARLSAVVSAASRAHPALSSPQDPSGLDAGFLGRPDGARCHRHLWDRVDPSHARGPQPPADRPERPLESPVDCRRETVSLSESVGVDRGVGMCHRQCRGQHLSMADSAGRWADDRPKRHRLPCRGGRSQQP